MARGSRHRLTVDPWYAGVHFRRTEGKGKIRATFSLLSKDDKQQVETLPFYRTGKGDGQGGTEKHPFYKSEDRIPTERCTEVACFFSHAPTPIDFRVTAKVHRFHASINIETWTVHGSQALLERTAPFLNDKRIRFCARSARADGRN